MQPRCIILDEATSMLDPTGRRGLREIIQRLHAQGVTVVMITQDMDEAAMAERVILLSQGRIIRDDSPRKVMTDEGFMQSVGLDQPLMARMSQEIHSKCRDFPDNLLTVAEIVTHIGRLSHHGRTKSIDLTGEKKLFTEYLSGSLSYPEPEKDILLDERGVIKAHDLWYTYMRGTPLETVALRGVDFTVQSGKIVGVIGATGSGKSTLLQHLNGLLFPQSGGMRIANKDITVKQTNLRLIRQQVALLFQHPEDQLFERYIADDVAYGPMNLGLHRGEIRQRVERAMEAVGLPLEVFRDRSIYSLSGGERRRAALAGVLALEPKVLVLDEVSAGLDPRGRRELMGLLRNWQAQGERSIVWASHSMEEIAQIAQRITVLADGRVIMEGSPRQVFNQPEALASYGLDVPQVVHVMSGLAQMGLEVPRDVLTLEEAVPAIERLLN